LCNRRKQQNESFQKLVNLYETDPTNSKQITQCMHIVQEYGQPPKEIIQLISPGLELNDDDEGGLFPNIFGENGVPPFGQMKDEDCTIM
jgi:Pex19 protein family